jgi:hypothetical protein
MDKNFMGRVYHPPIKDVKRIVGNGDLAWSKKSSTLKRLGIPITSFLRQHALKVQEPVQSCPTNEAKEAPESIWARVLRVDVRAQLRCCCLVALSLWVAAHPICHSCAMWLLSAWNLPILGTRGRKIPNEYDVSDIYAYCLFSIVSNDLVTT